jgi:5-methyltetrahydrofolate--homocysteine methyltransferase
MDQRDGYVAGVRADYDKIRIQHRDKKGPGPLLPIAETRRLGHVTDWASIGRRRRANRNQGAARLPAGKAGALHRLDAVLPGLGTLRPYPKILEDPVVGDAARKLHAEALETLDRIVREKWVRRTACSDFRAARVNGDDIEIYADERARPSP